jgi:polysaccharide export outer membrane protein
VSKKIIRLQIISIIIAMGICVTACETTEYPPAPKRVSSLVHDTEYRLGPLEQIKIFVWRSPELSTTVTIRPDGKISVPLIEDLQAAGKTPTELAREIEGKLSSFVKKPLVTVIVGGFTGDLEQQVRVIGQSKKPQSIAYRSGMTVLDVMISVGGLREFADGNRATLTRGKGTARKTYSLKLDDLIGQGDIRADVPVQPGDVIIIPETEF